MSDSHELAWAAGFFDGEGSVWIRPGVGVGQARLSISQVDREVLDRFIRVVGFGVVRGPMLRERERGRSPIHVLYMGRRYDIEQTMSLLWPWLGMVKRNQWRQVQRQLIDQKQEYRRQPYPPAILIDGISVCLRCKAPLPEGIRGSRRYCSPYCKNSVMDHQRKDRQKAARLWMAVKKG